MGSQSKKKVRIYAVLKESGFVLDLGKAKDIISTHCIACLKFYVRTRVDYTRLLVSY